MISARSTPLLKLLCVALAACEGVLGIEVLPVPDDGAGAAAGGDAGQPERCSSTADPCECFPGEERCTSGNGHQRCSEVGVWKEEPCGAVTPVCSGGSCTHVERLVGGFGHHACAVLGDGTLRCWGWNEAKQIGAPFEGPYAVSPQVIAGVTAVANGDMSRFNTCVVLADASARCWGENADAQLGDGSSGPATSDPVVVALADVAELATGGFHTCGRTTAGAVHCWGADGWGQLGHGTMGVPSIAPGPPVALPGPATDICVGSEFSCAVVNGGSMWCWGANHGGALGNGRLDVPSASPVAVELTGVLEIACGDLHACARTRSGVACWGNNGGGQAGGTRPSGDVILPAAIDLPAGPPTIELSSGWRHVCALREDGEVLCWGRNTTGQLGVGRIGGNFEPEPRFVDLPSPARDLAGLWNGACVALEDGTVRCWGEADRGQLGNGTTTASSSTPTEVVWSE